jgi:hypothetical protein
MVSGTVACAPARSPLVLPSAPGTLAYVVAYELGVPRAGFAVERLVALDASSGEGSDALAPVVLSGDGRTIELRLYALLFTKDLAGLGLSPGLLAIGPNGAGAVLPDFNSAYLATATATSTQWNQVASVDSILTEVRIRPGH